MPFFLAVLVEASAAYLGNGLADVQRHALSAVRCVSPLRMDAGLNDYEFELAFATRVCREAGQILVDPTAPELAISDTLQMLDFELSHEPAVSLGAKWVSHVDEHIVAVALVHASEGPLIGAVSRPFTNEVLAAAVNGGAFMQVGDGPPTRVPDCGFASTRCNVIHVPHAKCPELEMALENLHEKMPVDVTRVHKCCCCEGLFELVAGRADVHVTPPEDCYRGQTMTPVPVLCAFEVLLHESGGYMSDILGNDIDFAEATASGAHKGGVLAAEAASHAYMLNAVRPPFKAEKLVLPRLAERLQSSAPAFTVEYVDDEEDSSESIVMGDPSRHLGPTFLHISDLENWPVAPPDDCPEEER